ncbi:MAG: 2-aminoethylphosphonate--pyruvate transaminase [Planctomycetota bacterium]
METSRLPGSRDKLLFTPGPLTTSQTVKQAMLRDLGSRDAAFLSVVREIRHQLLDVGQVSEPRYTTVLMQGSGTFAIEAVLSSAVAPDAKVLIVTNGAYGRRMVHIASVLRLHYEELPFPENERVQPAAVSRAVAADPSIRMVAMVQCETTSGIVNPIREVGEIVRGIRGEYFVDAMSSFGAIPVDLANDGIDYLVSSANKCIEGVPGFSFVLARRDSLAKTEGYARSVSLDLFAQWKGLEGNGQFRFTPPTHALLAFHQALNELKREGGVEGRGNRYRENYRTLIAGMRKLGFQEFLPAEDQGFIITSFRYPDHPNFKFEIFYDRLSERGFVIYPGKVTNADCFRIGNIGRIFPSDVKALLGAIREVADEMKLTLKPLT